MANREKKVKLDKLQLNPDNPRIIKKDAFLLLVDNVIRYPKFLPKKQLVHKDNIIFCGNQRYSAIKHISEMPAAEYQELCKKWMLGDEEQKIWDNVRKYKSIPETWLASAADLTDEELKALIMLDNKLFGEHDWDKLANDWDEEDLKDWGVVKDNWSKDENLNNDLLQIDQPTVRKVEFEVTDNKPSVTHDDYAVFQQLLHKDDKKKVEDLLNKVQAQLNTEKQSDAFMHIVNQYKL